VNGMDPVWAQVEQFRREHFAGQLSALPVDVFTVAELDLRLDIIPFDDLFAKYGLDAMLLQDFTGIYIDAETYQYLEHGPVWKQKRLRFTFAHELGHYVLHRAEAKLSNPSAVGNPEDQLRVPFENLWGTRTRMATRSAFPSASSPRKAPPNRSTSWSASCKTNS